MKFGKKLFLFILMFALIAISSVSAKKPPKDKYKLPEFYYQEGCAALKKGKIEIAKENFKKGIENNILFTSFPTDWSSDVAISMQKDISKAEAFENNGIEWKVYYYKGLLESNLVFSRGFGGFVVKGKVAMENKELAIQSLEKSISIFDNYQSHVVLSILKPEDEEAEFNKIVNSALAIPDFESAYSAEHYIGGIYEEREQFEIAIQHYEKSLVYFKKWTGYELSNIEIRQCNKKIALLPKIKNLGFANYKEYEEYKNRIHTIIFGNKFLEGKIVLAQVAEYKDELEKAINIFDITEKDFAVKIEVTLGFYYERQEEFEKAIAYYKKAQKNNEYLFVDYENLIIGEGVWYVGNQIMAVNEKIKLKKELWNGLTIDMSKQEVLAKQNC